MAQQSNVHWIACVLSLSKTMSLACDKPNLCSMGGVQLHLLEDWVNRSCRTSFMAKLRRNGDMGHPCRTPMETTKGGEDWPHALTRPNALWYKTLKIDMYFSGTPFPKKQQHNADLSTESRAAQMSKNTMIVGLWKAKQCSVNCRTVKIWWMHPRPARNPACSPLVSPSHVLLNLRIMTHSAVD